MPNTPNEQIRECLAHVEECARKAAAQTNPTLKQDFLDMGWRWLALAKNYSGQTHLEVVTIPFAATELPSSDETDHNRATLTINVFQEEGRFGWTVHRRATKEVLGRGVAPTELKARVDAFRAGMTFIERLTGEPSPDGNNNLH